MTRDRDAQFLTRASVLDRMSGPMCDAVLRTYSSAERLESLVHSNLLVIARADPLPSRPCRHVEALVRLVRRGRAHAPLSRRRDGRRMGCGAHGPSCGRGTVGRCGRAPPARAHWIRRQCVVAGKASWHCYVHSSPETAWMRRWSMRMLRRSRSRWTAHGGRRRSPCSVSRTCSPEPRRTRMGRLSRR